MNAKPILAASLVLNAALAAAILLRPGNPSPSPAPETSAKPAAQAPAKPGAVAAAPGAIVEKRTTNVVVRTFNWESVESADYRQYIANLRSVGCPDKTIRDIILADVTELYDQKKKLVRGGAKKFEYWKPGMAAIMGGGDPETTAKLKDIDDERDKVLRDLGIEPDHKSQAAALVGQIDNVFNFLPDEKRTAVMKIMTDMQTKMAKTMENGQPDMAEVAKVQKEMDKAVKALLSPEEALDFDLRLSTTATIMRMQSAGFQPNEKEFLDVFKLRKSYDDEFSLMVQPGDLPKDEQDKRAAAEKKLKDDIKATLGEQRYAEYERAQDYNFQQMLNAAKKADLGVAEAAQVYDMKKVAEQKASELRNNKNLAAADRTAALQAIRAETERAMQQTLGEKGWQSYNKQNNTYWLKGLSPDPAPPTSPTKVQP
jgi:hypothetical protein